MREDDIVFDIKDLSQFLNVGISSVRKLIYERKIPFYKIGCKYFFRKSAIEMWILNMEKNSIKKDGDYLWE